jgi:hypothetical protein
MHVTCPTCSEAFPVTAGFLEADGKRFGMLLAGMEPALGRAMLEYLPLFTPTKQKLRLSRAVKLVAALDAMVREGSVTRDERTSARRAATTAHWVAGIEQMLEQRARLTLPLINHHYLRSVVYGIADQADAAAERQREASARAGRGHAGPSIDNDVVRARLMRAEAFGRIQSDLDLGLISQEEADERRAKLLRPEGESDGTD